MAVDLLFQLTIMFEISLEQLDGVLNIMGTTITNVSTIFTRVLQNSPSLTDRVHAELSISHIHSPSSQSSRKHRSNGRTTARIISYNKQLQWNLLPLGDFLCEDDTRRVCGVSGIGVDLDDWTLVHLWTMRGLVLLTVVWMDGVGLIARPEHGFDEGLFVCGS